MNTHSRRPFGAADSSGEQCFKILKTYSKGKRSPPPKRLGDQDAFGSEG